MLTQYVTWSEIYVDEPEKHWQNHQCGFSPLPYLSAHSNFLQFFLLPFPGSYLHQMWVTSCNRCEQPSRKLNTSSNVELITMGPAAPVWEDTVILCHVVLCLSAVGAAWWPPRGPQMTGRKWIRFPFLPVEESYDCDDVSQGGETAAGLHCLIPDVLRSGDSIIRVEQTNHVSSTPRSNGLSNCLTWNQWSAMKVSIQTEIQIQKLIGNQS